MFFLLDKPGESKLVNQHKFYSSFIRDLKNAKIEVIIESPFITSARMEFFYPLFEDLVTRNIKIHILTRDPVEHEDEFMRDQTTNEILRSVELGVNVIATAKQSGGFCSIVE